jgi:hypothetical protein
LNDIVFIIHGFRDEAKEDGWMYAMKDALLNKDVFEINSLFLSILI